MTDWCLWLVRQLPPLAPCLLRWLTAAQQSPCSSAHPRLPLSRGTSAAPRRSQWAQHRNDPRLLITEDFQIPLTQWADYRWLVHVDGITCSSRLEKLLSLGSLVLREESGYRWGLLVLVLAAACISRGSGRRSRRPF